MQPAANCRHLTRVLATPPKMKCPERIVVQECRVGAEMLTAVHSDNASEYRPLLKQLLLAQPEHRVLERLGRSDMGLTMTTDPPTRAASRATCSARDFEDTPMKDSSDIPTIISAQNP